MTIDTALTDCFDQIRIINLPARADRRREMAGELARLGLSLNRGSVRLFEAARFEKAGEFPSVGARGCFASHLGVIEEALSTDARHVLILEDDLDFTMDINKRLAPTLAALSRVDWAIFYGGYEGLPVLEPSDAPIAPIAPSTPVQTTHFIGLSRMAMIAAVPYFRAMAMRVAGDPAGGPMHVDGAYSWLRRDHPTLSTYLAAPPLGYQRASRTDIHALNLMDRMPGLREMMQILRKFKRSRARKSY